VVRVSSPGSSVLKGPVGLWGPQQPPVQWVPVSFPGREIGRGMALITQLHLVPRFRMSGVMPPIPLYAVMMWTETNLLTSYLFTYVVIHSRIPWLFGPLRTLANIIKVTHSSLSTAFCRHLLNFISLKSFSNTSSLLSLGLPVFLIILLLLLLPCSQSNIFLTTLSLGGPRWHSG